MNPIYLMGNVHPDKAVRDAADPCLTKYTTLSTEIFQSEKLFARLMATKAANPRQAKLRKDLLEGFEDSGVALPAEKRRRAKEIFDRLEELRQEFDQSIRDDPAKVVVTPAEMEGMPEAYVAAQKKDADGNYVLGLDYPAYVPFLANAKSEAARERYYVAKQREGGEENLARLDEIFRLRKELAGLYGLPSFAHYSLRRKMVGTAGDRREVPGRGEGRRDRGRNARTRGTSRREGEGGGQERLRGRVQPLGRELLAGAREEGALRDRPGGASQVLPDGQGDRLRAQALRDALRREVHRARGFRVARRTCATST